jgi:predicted aldo/keto reductase-like oxidoreductase
MERHKIQEVYCTDILWCLPLPTTINIGHMFNSRKDMAAQHDKKRFSSAFNAIETAGLSATIEYCALPGVNATDGYHGPADLEFI